MKKLMQILVASLVGGPAAVGICAAQTDVVVDTGQSNCYDNRSVIASPKPGQPFYGQMRRIAWPDTEAHRGNP